jgi:Tfp pilus assembly protein FimT
MTPSRPTNAIPPVRHSGEAGFSLFELLVVLVIIVEIAVIVSLVFQTNQEVARVQTDLSEVQQSLRFGQLELARHVRLAGRGGLRQNSPMKTRPDQGAALEVLSNVSGAAQEIAPGTAGSPDALENTDILVVRGVFESPVFQIRTASGGTNFFIMYDQAGDPTTDPVAARSGEIHLCQVTDTGFPQSLDRIRDAIAEDRAEALVLVSAVDPQWTGVVALDPGNSQATSSRCDPTNPSVGAEVAFTVQGSAPANDYRELGIVAAGSNGLPAEFGPTASLVGILEEYRFYIREEREVIGDNSTPLLPRLSRARLYPNTGLAWDGDAANLSVDMADGIYDLQVSLAFDTAQGGSVALEDVAVDSPMIFESADGANDDWLFNAAGDRPDLAGAWASTDPRDTNPWQLAQIYAVRINTVGRTARPDQGFQAELLGALEDRTYDNSADSLDSTDQRQYRRQVLTTLVDTRNI